MGVINWLVDFILHLDVHLNSIIQSFGLWTYLIIFSIIFAETGLVMAPFLPGDSLLFAAGTFAAIGSLNISLVFIVVTIAAIVGDSVNYAMGKYIGPKMFKEKSRFLKKEYLDKTNDFYKKYGKKTIVLARFVPIVRTFAPFLAGLGKMDYKHFLFYNVFGAIPWAGLFVFGGYFFGNITIIKENFQIAILCIVILSFMPVIYEFWKHHKGKKKAKNL